MGRHHLIIVLLSTAARTCVACDSAVVYITHSSRGPFLSTNGDALIGASSNKRLFVSTPLAPCTVYGSQSSLGNDVGLASHRFLMALGSGT